MKTINNSPDNLANNTSTFETKSFKRRGQLHQKVRKLRYLQSLVLIRKVSWQQRIVSLFLLVSIFSTTVCASPDASRSVAVSLDKFKDDVRFGLDSTNIGDSLFSTAALGFFFKFFGTSQPRVERIVILPKDENGNLAVMQGENVNFTAVGLQGERTVSGLQFTWSVTDAGRRRAARTLNNGIFNTNIAGTFIVVAATRGLQSQITVTVQPNEGFVLQKLLQKNEAERNERERQELNSLRARGAIITRDISTKSGYNPDDEERRDRENTIRLNQNRVRQNQIRDRRPNALQNSANIPPSDAKFEGVDRPESEGMVDESLLSGENIKNTESAKSVAPPVARPADEDGWGGGNWWTADDPDNQIGNPPGTSPDAGAGNGNFQFSAPVVSLPGRGMDVNLSLNYNSRLWSKSGNTMSFDSDKGSPAPGWNLGFGKMMYMGSNGGCMLVDADGTRRSYTGSNSTYSYGSYYSNSFTGHTADGSFIDYNCYYSSSTYGTYLSGSATLPNGVTVSYNSQSLANDQVYPTSIADTQGNYITISYQSNRGPNIDTVTDTMGRISTFNYDSLNRLISVTVPGFDGGAARTAVRLHYKTLTLNYAFAYGIATDTNNNYPYVLDAIYYPGTNTGYWFGDADSYSSYGMIAKVVEQRGMSWSGSAGDQGTVTPGTMSKQAVYDYPLAPDSSLTDAPAYSNLTESWAGMDTAPAVTNYLAYMNSTPRTITVTQPNGVKSKQYMYKTPGVWNDGLIYQDETIAPDNTVLSKSVVTWAQGAYDTARPSRTEVTDERNQTTATDLLYGTVYNQLTSKKEYDYNGSLLRENRSTYENNAAYTGRHIFNLVKSNEVYDNLGNRVAKTDYEYDNNAVVNGTANHNLKTAPGVIMHKSTSDPYTTETTTIGGYCAQWQYNYPECELNGEGWAYVGEYPQFEVYCPNERYCTNYIEEETVSVYDPNSLFRGNVTKTTSYADATNQTGANVNSKQYDVTGNLATESASCCELKTYDYTVATQYAYPGSASRGSSDPNSPLRNTGSSTFDFNTGLVKTSIDENGRTDSTTYNVNTLRSTQLTSSTGAYSQIFYDDTAMTVTSETHESGGNLAGKSIKYLNGIGQIKREEAFGVNNVWDAVETKYTNLGQTWKQSRPFRNGDTLQWTEMVYDLLGRTKQVISPDGSISQVFYNETARPDSASALPGETSRQADAWGRERWSRTDALGRLVEVVEPNPSGNGSVLATGSLVTKYSYNTLNKLTQTEQGGQFRNFKYDSLGRMTRQKLAEQSATINDAGQYLGEGITGANWSGAVFYDNLSNIVQKIDPRGVKTNYSYQLGGGDDPLNRIQSVSYDLTGARDTSKPIQAVPSVLYEYMTTGDQARIKKVTSQGISTDEYFYDGEGRVTDTTQTLLNRPSYPLTTSFIYDSLSRIAETRYPAQYGMAGNPRKVVANTFDADGRLTSLTVNGQQQAGNIVYNASSQTTSINIGTAGANQVNEQYSFDQQTGLLTNQKAIRNGQTLLDLSYDYNRNNSTGNTNGKTSALTKTINNLYNNKNREYQYDALGRLVSAKGGATSNLWQQQYIYDRFGNRTNVTATGVAADNSAIPRDGLANVSYNTATNRITTAGFEYDVAGNQTRALAEDGVNWLRFEYDAANRLVFIKQDNGTLIQSQEFNIGNNRISLTDYVSNQKTYYQGASEYTEYGNNGSLWWSKIYVYLGKNVLSTFTSGGGGTEIIEFNHPDKLGTRLVTNQQTGTSFEQTTLPFGIALGGESSGSVAKRFTSYERSAQTGLDYAQNRTYDSKQGRFTQVDPIGMSATNVNNPQTLNLYNYVGNDPINRTDPTGLFWGAIKRFFRAVLRVLLFVALVVATVVLISTGVGLIAAGGFANIIFGLALLYGASFLAAKIGATIASGIKELRNRCRVPDFNGLSQARQNELTQRGVSQEQWDRLKNNQRLGYFNITAAIAAAGLSLFGWLVDWAAGGIQQDRTFFRQGAGATNLLAQVQSSNLFSRDKFLGTSFRQNSLTRSTELTFSSEGRRLEIDIDFFNPNRGVGGFLGHSYEVVSHTLGRIFGGSRTNPYNVAYRASWECK